MGRYDQYSDEELIVRLREGETEISDYLMEKYKEFVRKKARAMFLIGGETDDLIQEGMIGLFKAIRDYRGDKEASFYTFAQLCVDRQMYNAIQSSTRQKHQPLNSYISMNGEEWETQMGSKTEQSPETIIIAQENAVQMEEKIRKQLSTFENEVLTLYLDGNNYQQIGEKMNKSSKSIDNALQRIKGKVRESLGRKK